MTTMTTAAWTPKGKIDAPASATEAFEFRLPLRTEAELRQFVRLAWGVQIPDQQVCPDHSTPWRAFADAYFARHRVTVWKASRGFGGKTFLLAALSLTEAALLQCDVNALGGSGEQSANVLKYSRQFWQYKGAPRYLLASEVQRETRLAGGNAVKALMASQTSVRGPHVPRLRLDEVDEMSLDIFHAALGQTMSKRGIAAQTVISSTHHNPDGTMTEVLRQAATRNWPVYEFCYRETVKPHGWLDPSEVEGKRQEVPDSMFRVEYDLQEPAPESRAIQPEAVEAMFRPELGHHSGRNQEYIEVEPPQPGASYSTGADWARKEDWTIIATLRTDVKPVRLVAFERCGRLPWPVMVGKFEERLRQYPGAAAHDGTGLGDVVDSYLIQPAISVLMVGRARSDLLSNYIAAVERQELESPDIEFLRNEHRYASVDDVYGSGHLPDSIAAMALAWHGATQPVYGGTYGVVTIHR